MTMTMMPFKLPLLRRPPGPVHRFFLRRLLIRRTTRDENVSSVRHGSIRLSISIIVFVVRRLLLLFINVFSVRKSFLSPPPIIVMSKIVLSNSRRDHRCAKNVLSVRRRSWKICSFLISPLVPPQSANK